MCFARNTIKNDFEKAKFIVNKTHYFSFNNIEEFCCYSLTWSDMSIILWMLMLANFRQILLYSGHYFSPSSVCDKAATTACN